MKKNTDIVSKLKDRLFYLYLSVFHKDLFQDLNSHSWPRGDQLKNKISGEYSHDEEGLE